MESAAHLKNFFAQENAKVDARQKDILHMMTRYAARRKEIYAPPKITVFEGVEELKNIFNDFLMHHDIPTYNFWTVKTANDLLGTQHWHDFNIQRIRNRIYVHAIWPETQVVDRKKFPHHGSGKGFYREIRIAPKGLEWTMSSWIYANKILYLSSKKECYGFLVESDELVNLSKIQHKTVWDLSTPLITNPDDVKDFLAKV
jgi:hypothetical protein